MRYKCAVCHDFDFCEECEATKSHPHCFIKIKKPFFDRSDFCHRGMMRHAKQSVKQFVKDIKDETGEDPIPLLLKRLESTGIDPAFLQHQAIFRGQSIRDLLHKLLSKCDEE